MSATSSIVFPATGLPLMDNNSSPDRNFPEHVNVEKKKMFTNVYKKKQQKNQVNTALIRAKRLTQTAWS